MVASLRLLPCLAALAIAGCSPPERSAPTVEEIEAMRFEGTRTGVVQTAGDPVVGDLDGRRGDEFVVVLTEPGAGDEVLVYLALVDRERAPILLLLGDRVGIGRLTIEDGSLVGEVVVPAEGDSQCCPTLRQRVRWRLQDGALRETERESLGRIER